MRKIITFLSVLFIFCILWQAAAFAVTASPTAEERVDLAVAFLDAIDVLPDLGPLHELDMEKNLSRGEFAEAMVKAAGGQGNTSQQVSFSDVPNDHPKAGYITAAVQMGLMKGYGDGSFLPDYPVRYEEAVKVAIVALGYGVRAEVSGGYPAGYLSEAHRLSMLDYVNGKMGNFITVGDFAMMLTNMLNTPLLEISQVSGESVVLENNSARTMLNTQLGIERTVGQITQTERSALTGVTSSSEGLAAVDGVTYKSAGSNVNDYLGYRATVYYKNDNEILFVWPEKYETLTVSAENIVPDNGEFSITCLVYEDEAKKVRKAKISPYADLIYNGVSVGGYNTSDMTPDNGWVELLDNDRDGAFDVIFVEEYTNMIVGTVNATGFTVIDSEDSNKFVELNPNETEEYFFKIEMDGLETDFASIEQGNVLSVFESRNTAGVKFRRVIISKNNMVATMQAKEVEDGKTTIIINGTGYKASQYFIDNFSSLPLQTTGRFLLNFEGYLVGYSGSNVKINSYGYLLNAGVKGGIAGDAQFKMLTEYGEIVILTAAERLNVDGKFYRNHSQQSELINGTTLKQADGSYRQIVRYKLDENGLLTELDTKNPGAVSTDELTEDVPFDSRWYYNNGFGYHKFDFLIDTATICFFVPKDDNEDIDNEELYFARIGNGGFAANGIEELTVAAYDINDILIPKAIVVKQDVAKTNSNAKRAMIVDKIVTMSDDSIRLTGYLKGAYVTYYVEDTALQNRVKSFKQGDLIIPVEDMGGDLVYARKILTPQLDLRVDTFKKSDEDPSFDPEDSEITYGDGDNVIYLGRAKEESEGGIKDQFRGHYSVLLRKGGSNIVLSGMNVDGTPNINTDDISAMFPLAVPTNASVVVYNAEEKTVNKVPIADLDNYTYSRNPNIRVFVHTYGGTIRDIFVFDNLAN